MQTAKDQSIAVMTMMEKPGFLKLRFYIGVAGLLGAGCMLLWLITSAFGLTISMIDVFGIEGIRTPAGIAIGGLIMAAVGFNKF